MKMMWPCLLYVVLIASGAFIACSQFETGYFQNKVDQATQDMVARRYGEPHKVDKLSEERSIWTYFDRGTSTTGYGSYARPSSCKAYLLTCDQSGILRDWQQQKCASESSVIIEPSSSHN